MPALAIAERVRRERPDLEPVLVGAERGIEASLLPTRDFRFHLLPVEPIYRRQWWKNLRWPFVMGSLLSRLGKVFDTERPVAVLGTGGYASGPCVWLGTRRGIPTAIQEQNAFPGLVTRLLSKRVDQVYLGLPEARARLTFGRQTTVFDTGNPIAPPEPERRQSALRRFGLVATSPRRHGSGEQTDARGDLATWRPVVLITGGSQGALAINEATARWIDAGGANAVTVLWATGRGSYERFARYHRPPGVQVFGFLDPMADGYAVADLVVARAGMMTGAELCAWGLPSVLIPLPTAAADHQRHNAEALAAAGAAEMVLQSELEGGFGSTISALLADHPRRAAMARAALDRGKPEAAGEIVGYLLGLIPGREALSQL